MARIHEHPTLFFNGVVIDPTREGESVGTGLRMEKGVITHVFDSIPDVGDSAHRVDLDGATVLPGLVDAHIHLRSLGATARGVALRDATSAEQVISRVQSVAERIQPGAWIKSRGWDETRWSDARLPGAAERRALDEASGDHPVWLTRVDGHAAWLNVAALRLAGIDSNTDNPTGGQILRDEAGHPTGVLVDNAIEVAQRALPEAPVQEVREDFLQGMRMCNEVGLTAVHDMCMTPREFAQLQHLERQGQATLGVEAYLYGDTEALEPLLKSERDPDALMRVAGVKLFADGALGSHGAALLEPYTDKPGDRGLVVTELKHLIERSSAVSAMGYEVAIHAIGDHGNRMALDTVQAIGGAQPGVRHRVEHAQILHPDDIERFAETGAIASMQPLHATNDMRWVESRLGADRVRGAYAWRSVIDGGAPLLFGSDAPIEAVNPWLGLHAATTRQDGSGFPAGGWMAQQCVTIAEALQAYSTAALSLRSGAPHPGMVPGTTADLTIVDRNPMAIAASALPQVKCLGVVVGGRQVFSASGALKVS